MARKLLTIGFDADDTLWHNERFFALTQERVAALLADYAERDHLDARLLEAERSLAELDAIYNAQNRNAEALLNIPGCYSESHKRAMSVRITAMPSWPLKVAASRFQCLDSFH